jgi:hypothetical protein
MSTQIALRTDHATYLCAEEGGGYQGQQHAGRPEGLGRANRTAAGAWEQFTIEVLGEQVDGHHVVVLKSVGEFYGCSEMHEVGGQRVPVGFFVFNRKAVGGWEKLLLWQLDSGKLAFEIHDARGYFLCAEPDGRLVVRQPMADDEPTGVPGGYESFTPEPAFSLGGVVGGRGQLAYPVRASFHGWADANGPRPLLGCSFFPALYFEKHDPGHVDYVLDLLVAAGIPIVRAFAGVGGAVGWGRHLGDGWRGREVVPVRLKQSDGRVLEPWPDFEDVVRRFARKLRERGMGWDVTAGDLQAFASEEEVYVRTFNALASAGMLDVVVLAEVNEGWQNSRRGNNPSHFAKLVAPFAQAGIAWGTSAHPEGDAPGCFEFMGKGSDFRSLIQCIHGPGGTTMMVRHTFNDRFEGFGFEWGAARTEPRGPGPDVSAGQVNEGGWVALDAAMACMTGQLHIVHVSQGIRDLPSDHGWSAYLPYLQRAARLVARLPNAKLVACGHGGRGGNHPYAIGASTRPDGKFDEDAGVPSTGSRQFHRIDTAHYEDGTRAFIPYGGEGERELKMVADWTGTYFDSHGEVYRAEQHDSKGEIVQLGNCGDGLLAVGR